MQILQVTLGSAATRVTATSTRFQWAIIQNNTAHALRCGSSSVTGSVGISVAVNGGTLPINGLLGYEADLAELFLFGTAADVIDILYQP